MIKIKKLKDLTVPELDKLFYRYGDDLSRIIINTIIPIVNNIKKDGDKAVIKYTEKFDKVKLQNIFVTDEEIDKGHKRIPDKIIEPFLKAKKNIFEFHEHQKKDDINYTRDDGTKLGVMYQPIEKAAIYIPGGKASYPSSVLMGVIPAIIAGVKDITLVTPPDNSGNIPDIILAMCKTLDVKKIIKSGGAQGVAAAALGTDTINKSDIIVGPGNIFVTAAKTYLFSLGIIQIDSIAGPSEVLIISDGDADPGWVAYDMLSQAEHDEMSIALLITTSESHAEKVKEEINRDLDKNSGRHEIKKSSIKDNGLILVVDNIEEAVEFSNNYGPEHMEFMVKDPITYLSRIKNVGSLFLGEYAPVSIGDYFSGTNHILPTGGAARFSSGTSVDTFIRRTTFQYPTKESLKNAMEPVNVMSKIEGFHDKHGGSINIRFKNKE